MGDENYFSEKGKVAFIKGMKTIFQRVTEKSCVHKQNEPHLPVKPSEKKLS
ncbi:hypothetical protein WMO63_19080 [Niallia sp. CLA-SR-H024]|uniref:Uncharacterized protein n=1 Tax=Niallia hominis TaxID=3133173 RepID=A0ABV1F4X1_9BACI